MEQLNIEEIKRYNKEIRDYREKATRISAELSFESNELSRLCKNLSDELGVEVTADNIENIYAQMVEKIKNTLEVGQNILKKIKADEEVAQTSISQAEAIAQGQMSMTQPAQAGTFNEMASVPTGFPVAGQVQAHAQGHAPGPAQGQGMPAGMMPQQQTNMQQATPVMAPTGAMQASTNPLMQEQPFGFMMTSDMDGLPPIFADKQN